MRQIYPDSRPGRPGPKRFEFDGSDFSYDPGYNIAPTESVLTVRNVEGREAAFMRWGLVPFWAKDPKIGARMINARAETVAEKPAFKNALKRRRCLVLADGYYEWQKTPVGKRPYQDNHEVLGSPLRIGRAVGDVEGSGQGNVDAVLHHHHDGTANDFLAPIHDRMPVILPQEIGEAVAGHGVRRSGNSHKCSYSPPRRGHGRLRGLDDGELCA